MRLFLAFALVAGCQPLIPPYTVHVPPRLVEVRPAPSVAFLKGDVPLDGLDAAIDGVIPAEVAGKRSVQGMELEWKLTRRPTMVRASYTEGLVIEASLLGEISAAGHGVKCHASEAGMVYHASARPGLRAGGELWLERITLHPAPKGNFSCAGLPFKLPLGTVLEWIGVPVHHVLEQALQELRVPLGPLVERALDELSQPRAISLSGVGVCLDLDARALVLAPLGGVGQKLTLKAGAEVAPRVSLGPCGPRHATPREVLARELALENSFQVMVAVAVPYDDLAARVAPLVEGQRMGDGANRVVIEKVELGDAEGHVLARVRVRGGVSGMLYLWGTPKVIDEGGRLILRVPDLRAAVETKSATQKLKLWLWQLVDGGLTNYLRKKLTLDVTDFVARAKTLIAGQRELGHDLTLSVEISQIQPGEVTSQTGAVILHPILVGTATVEGHFPSRN